MCSSKYVVIVFVTHILTRYGIGVTLIKDNCLDVEFGIWSVQFWGVGCVRTQNATLEARYVPKMPPWRPGLLHNVEANREEGQLLKWVEVG